MKIIFILLFFDKFRMENDKIYSLPKTNSLKRY